MFELIFANEKSYPCDLNKFLEEPKIGVFSIECTNYIENSNIGPLIL